MSRDQRSNDASPFKVGDRVIIGSGALKELRGRHGVVVEVMHRRVPEVRVQIDDASSPYWFYAYDVNPAPGAPRPSGAQTVCAYCGQSDGHSRRCSVSKFGVPEWRAPDGDQIDADGFNSAGRCMRSNCGRIHTKYGACGGGDLQRAPNKTPDACPGDGSNGGEHTSHASRGAGRDRQRDTRDGGERPAAVPVSPEASPGDWADGVDAAAGVLRAEITQPSPRPLAAIVRTLEELAENYPGRARPRPSEATAQNGLREEPVLVAAIALRTEIETLYIGRPTDEAAWTPCLDALGRFNRALCNTEAGEFPEERVSETARTSESDPDVLTAIRIMKRTGEHDAHLCSDVLDLADALRAARLEGPCRESAPSTDLYANLLREHDAWAHIAQDAQRENEALSKQNAELNDALVPLEKVAEAARQHLTWGGSVHAQALRDALEALEPAPCASEAEPLPFSAPPGTFELEPDCASEEEGKKP